MEIMRCFEPSSLAVAQSDLALMNHHSLRLTMANKKNVPQFSPARTHIDLVSDSLILRALLEIDFCPIVDARVGYEHKKLQKGCHNEEGNDPVYDEPVFLPFLVSLYISTANFFQKQLCTRNKSILKPYQLVIQQYAVVA